MNSLDELSVKFNKKIQELSSTIDITERLEDLNHFKEDLNEAYELNEEFVKKLGRDFSGSLELVESKLEFKIRQVERVLAGHEDLLEDLTEEAVIERNDPEEYYSESAEKKNYATIISKLCDIIKEEEDIEKLPFCLDAIDDLFEKQINKSNLPSNVIAIFRAKADEGIKLANEKLGISNLETEQTMGKAM